MTRDDGTRHLDPPGFDHFEQLVERFRKRGYALFGEFGSDRRHVNADCLQFVEDVMGFFEAGLKRWLYRAMIAKGLQASAAGRCSTVSAPIKVSRYMVSG